jgi:OOP family OmpA-OmpF porin
MKLASVVNINDINNLIQYKFKSTPIGQFTCDGVVHMIDQQIEFAGLLRSANKQSTAIFNDNFRADLLKNMKKMTIYTSLIMGVFVALSGASLSQAQTSVTTNQAGANAKIDVLGGGFTPLTNIGVSQSRIVVYRTFNTQQLPGATGVFIQGQYHTSLVPGGYSQLCLPPGQFEVGARQFRVGQNARDSYDTITAIALPPAQTQYVRVEESSGRPVMKPVTAAQALQELGATRLQVHTISRVTQAQNCMAVAAPVVAPVIQPEQFILPGDTLFAFGRSDLNGLTAAGRESLDGLISQIRNAYARVDRVHVIGHADPLGSPSVNDRLSVNRANTVRQYLMTNGQISAPVTAEGKGARQPVETRCPRQATAASIACNQVNRRVVMEVSGQRR